MSNQDIAIAGYNFTFADFIPEKIAAAIDELGEKTALTNQYAEAAKHQAEYILHQKIINSSKKSVSAATSEAISSAEYQEALKLKRETEYEANKAKSAFKAMESYSRMILTKVSSEAKIAEQQKKLY